MPLITEGLPASLKTIHIMGICGTAMGSLAAMLVDAGYTVTGSDTSVYPPMSEVLRGLGIQVMEGFKASNLEHRPDLVVVGNVVRAVYEEAVALLASDLPYCSFPQLLGELFLRDSRALVIAGTHGKTTTTALCTWILESAGRGPGYLIGGVPRNLDRTARRCLAPKDASFPRNFVIEGDEYDTAFFDKGPKFWHYRPQTAILTSVEFDHADIYRDFDHYKASFQRFVELIPPADEGGCLVACWMHEDVRTIAAQTRAELRRYGPGCAWDGRILDVDIHTGKMRFEVIHSGKVYGTFETCLVGEHNLWNQVAAVAALDHEGLGPEEMAPGFASFEGIKRRQELKGVVAGIAVIDDFAHHPTAVKLTLEALKMRFGDRRLWAIFEPRSNTSRRKIFQAEYAEAFDSADQVVVASPPNVESIAPDERFDPVDLVRNLQDRGIEAHFIPTADEIAATVAANAMPADVLAVLSNGGFGGLHGKLLDALKARLHSATTSRS